MIWEHKSRLIMMLCPFVGPKGDESIVYFPTTATEEARIMRIGNLFELKLLEYKQTKNLNMTKILMTSLLHPED